jgi:hypothetical protein
MLLFRMKFSVSTIDTPVRIYQMPFAMCSPSILCQTHVMDEHTVFKFKHEDDDFFLKNAVRCDTRWHYGFILHEDCPGIDHVGIVHFISGLFSKQHIPLLYLNTYSNNIILIAEENVTRAKEIMKQNDSILFEE